ncbi:polar amino acid transport system permease protein [Comamonas odontotermitis]|uniref:Polar amino acid transport system permease protein n=1 Tax=Comamonas odontotermitis TaxID=379895 RepID=A0ABR6RDR5_9BURK|nr:amino acid ABC transporter permease [Comamonas odontotermitis]MBB6577273.1 polar amino acid transport system permease protein [Comamonas odontotermitis]
MTTFDVQMLLSGQYHDMLVAGFKMSLQYLFYAFWIALPLGLVIALCRLSPFKALRWIGATYVELIRSIPLLAHMLFWYFGVPELLPTAWKEALYAGPVESICAVVALGVYTAAYMAEDIRSGIRAVPAVQMEASRALGLTYMRTMRLVILPQALRFTVPPLISQTLNMWKGTSIATVIGAAEMMYQAGQVESQSFRSFEAFAFASVAYLAVSLVITFAAIWFQRRYPVRTM